MYNTVLLFIFGLLLLIKGGDWFVDAATGIAHRFRIPELLIGATVVSIGTTLPEVLVSATAAVGGHGEIAYGNAIGSIICNTALIAAITVAVRPGKVDRRALLLPVCFFFGAAVFYAAIAYATGYFSRTVGFILLMTFAAYIAISVYRAITAVPDNIADADKDGVISKDEATAEEIRRLGVFKDILFLILGAVLIAVGADLLVNNGIIIAEELGVPESVIALTFVALGTSLPELVTAITSLAKGHGSLSLGNVIGANLFNLALVSGVSTVLSPFRVPNGSQIFGVNASLALEIPVMLGVMLILTLPSILRGKLSRVQGISLLCIYAAFCVIQFTM